MDSPRRVGEWGGIAPESIYAKKNDFGISYWPEARPDSGRFEYCTFECVCPRAHSTNRPLVGIGPKSSTPHALLLLLLPYCFFLMPTMNARTSGQRLFSSAAQTGAFFLKGVLI